MRQSEVVLDALKKAPLTSMEAFVEFGITRLGARIFELREEGYDIETIPMSITNRLGARCTYAKYVLKSPTPKPKTPALSS